MLDKEQILKTWQVIEDFYLEPKERLLQRELFFKAGGVLLQKEVKQC